MAVRKRAVNVRDTTNSAPTDTSAINNHGNASSVRRRFALACAAILLGLIWWTPLWSDLSTLLGLSRPDSHEINPPFVVRDLPGRGKGMIAVRDIRVSALSLSPCCHQRGELLIRERPLVLVPRQIASSPSQLILDSVRKLSPGEAAAFYNLSYVHIPQGLAPEALAEQLPLAIFQTNAVAAGSNVGLFPTMARLNHGCSHTFNSVYSWREREGVLVVYAFKAIKKDEELLTAYFKTQQTREERRRYLEQVYDFTCMCACCTLSEEKSKESDDRLSAMGDLQKRFSTWGHGAIDGREAIRIAKRIWSLGDAEGYTSERGRLAADATLVAAAHSDAEAVMAWARLAVRWTSYELGLDSELAEEMRLALSEPRRHPMWGRREAMQVGRPEPEMSGA
ncbi:hypothetical protein BC834DRAFT_1014364 [Gloeopeniophorella convolvens]|nr:hypothetical protein BC834DRAFT_1014364 [Gloeopeniophorella convolvens]